MCLIIKKPPGRAVSDEFLLNAWQRNADGWGGFFVDGDEVHWQRGLRFEELLRYNAALPAETEVYLHLRKATYGHVSRDMAHPYVVRNGLMLMHNGSISHLAPQDPSLSDTAEMARHLRDMLEGLSDCQASAVLRSAGFARLTAPLIDGSMVILMDRHGPVRLGRDWHTVRGCDWDADMAGIEVSNSHTWGRALSPVAEAAPATRARARTPAQACPP
jgi:hypothetical protein